PGIACVLDFSKTLSPKDEYFFVVMEYIQGEDLSERISRGPMTHTEAVQTAIAICQVLERAHNFENQINGEPFRGIIHGDIKPRNIRINAAKQVKILDFGIAKNLSRSRQLTR